MERCKNKPDFICTENKPGEDGQRGSMSLCIGCTSVMRKQLGRDFATIELI